MSRIIVKNLPRYLNEDRFKDHFSTYCGKHITDIKFIRSKNGKFRGFGFIGYKTNDDALNAIKYYHNTFVDMSRIIVEHAKEVDFRAFESKRLLECGNSLAKDHTYEKNGKLINKDIILKRKIQKNHELSTVLRNEEIENFEELFEKNQQTLVRKHKNSVDDSNDVNKVLVSSTCNIKDYTDSCSCNVLEKCKEKECRCFGLFSPKKSFNISNIKSMTDDEWLKSKFKQIVESDNDELFDSDQKDQLNAEDKFQNGISESRSYNSKLALKNEILLSGRLFVRNLPYSISENELRDVFEKFGKLINVHVPFDFTSNMAKGFAYLLFESSSSAVDAYENMDGRPLYGRLIHILPAQIKHSDYRPMSLSEMNFKTQRVKRRKIDAPYAQFSWNSLYMNPDAVISSVADKFGLSKAEVLDPASSNAAVRQALAETYVIQETKIFFEKSGVNLESFSCSERDDCVLLVKNFSYGTTVNELFELFRKYGSLGRILLPPSGTIAIVEFLEPKYASDAFKHLSYRKFKDSILYLEKAPLNIFKDSFDWKMNSEIVNTGPQSLKVIHDIDINVEDSDLLDTERATLFIKNLNFSTTLDSLRNVFSSLNGFINVVIKTKPDPKRPGNKLSMGFGFVEFKTRSHALEAMSIMKDYVLDGHVLQIKESEKSCDSFIKKTSNDNRCKIIIKNLPFEATKNDIKQLFGSYGHLKSVRVPKKIDNSIRGFAFVDFFSSRDAKNAFNVLQNTHLLGRHLILEWAFDDSLANNIKCYKKND
ncbi:hypothetical protein PMAC_000331 [Pneumocystis sp. 'macacae']|nr:hypothetical protein PMAC_000331 [Pneumocystis sp. 'macacae']